MDGSVHALIVLLVPAHSMLLYQDLELSLFLHSFIPNPGFIPKTYQNPYAFNNPYLKDCDTLYVFYLLYLYNLHESLVAASERTSGQQLFNSSGERLTLQASTSEPANQNYTTSSSSMQQQQ